MEVPVALGNVGARFGNIVCLGIWVCSLRASWCILLEGRHRRREDCMLGYLGFVVCGPSQAFYWMEGTCGMVPMPGETSFRLKVSGCEIQYRLCAQLLRLYGHHSQL